MSSPFAANPTDATVLADELARFRVVESKCLADLLAEFHGGSSEALADYLIGRGAINAFQARRALAGGARWLSIGAYRLIGESNPGTFGPLYSARHREHPGEFRLRLFPLRSMWRARQAKQIARALAAAPHPSIVPLSDADSANGLHYLAWPDVEGISLGDRVAAQGPLAAADVTELLVQLANGVHACHLLGIGHGTITPQAIVQSDGIWKLLEYGAGAILVENLSADESLLDTLSATVATATVLEFAAPEFISNPGALTGAADQYALGAVAYFALTGRMPFPADTSTSQLAYKLAGPPQPLAEVNPAIPEPLAAVIDRMLRPAPEDRFSSLPEAKNRLLQDGSFPPDVPASSVTVVDFPRRLRIACDESATPMPVPPAPAREAEDDSPTQFRRPPAPAAVDTPIAVHTPPGKQGRELPEPFPSPEFVARTPAPPTSPHDSESPVREDQSMAKLATPDTRPAKASDPRLTVGAPIHYHTETPPDPSSGIQPGLPPVPELGEPPATDTHLWRRLKRNVLFWKPATDVAQVSVFGPSSLTPGQSSKLSVYVHTPGASESVHTLCRAFHHDVVLVGAGYISREVAREETVDVHLSVSNAGVTKSMLNFMWRGQPHRLVFDLHVPWESPAGLAPGVVSVGVNNVRIGKIDFWLQVLPRRS